MRAEDNEPVLSATTALLVRPDGYVAWATDTGTETDPEDLRAALQRWFGDPQNTAVTAGEAVATAGSST